jgi:hypothetical protein
MKRIEELRGYGVSFSDAEGGWDDDFKAKLKNTAQRVIAGHLSSSQKVMVLVWFVIERIRAAFLDLSDLRNRGMNNKAFLRQQLSYVSVFSALKKVCGKEMALKIMFDVMNATAEEALLLSLPDVSDIREAGEPIEVLRKLTVAQAEAARKSGCHEMKVAETTERVVQFEVHWCVWLELAKKMGVPEACLPNCYADDLAYPKYFRALGIEYSRTGTLAQGCKNCNFRFERVESAKQ